MSDNWGAAPSGQNGDAIDTTIMSAALPEGNADSSAASGQAQDSGFMPVQGWVNAQKIDYEAMTNGDHQWDGSARIYEWDGEEGDVGPEFPELEIQLFGAPDERGKHGIDFTKIESIKLVQEGPIQVQPINDFDTAGLHPVMLKNVKLAGYEVPTPIQKYALPTINLGYDCIAIAQTGSGKTAAYLIPILNKLMGKAKKLAAPRPNPATFRMGIDPPVRAEPLVVIVCPARELAVQIFNEARKFCYRTMLRPCVVYGGGPIAEQIAQLTKGCDILVATPGRLIDFISRPHILTLRRLRYMVIDEADEMLHADWEEDFKKILTGGEQDEGNVKYMLFSATFPKHIRDLAKSHLSDNHVRLAVGRAGSTHENISQNIVFVDPAMKRKALYDLMISLPPTRTIIFVNNKRTADELDDFLFHLGVPCASMHADRTQREREATMRAFRRGESPVLIATGVTARGIDVRNVMHVINYDLPSMEHGGIEEYTHRIGRTGRMGHRGLATSFYTDRDEPIASVLTRTLMETKQTIPDFLESYKPEGAAAEHLKFEADSDFEEDDGNNGGDGGDGGDAWGASASTGDDTGNAGVSAWGAPSEEAKKEEKVVDASEGW